MFGCALPGSFVGVSWWKDRKQWQVRYMPKGGKQLVIGTCKPAAAKGAAAQAAAEREAAVEASLIWAAAAWADRNRQTNTKELWIAFGRVNQLKMRDILIEKYYS